MAIETLLLILAAISPGATEGRYPAAREVFRCGFEEDADRDYDTWPDGWTRLRGLELPHYVPVAISDRTFREGWRSLRMAADGGGAVIQAPAFAISPRYSYVLEGQVRTDKLQHDEVFLSLTLLDSDRQPLEVATSAKVVGSHDWQQLRVGPLTTVPPAARYAIVSLHMEPTDKLDLIGTVEFDDLWCGRLARMTVTMPRPENVYHSASAVQVNCELSGDLTAETALEFELRDVFGRVVEQLTKPLSVHAPSQSISGLDETSAVVGEATWQPAIPGPGFYRVRVTLPGDPEPVQQREMSLAVLTPQSPPKSGEFGWTLPEGAQPLPLAVLGPLLGQVGINLVKYPLWFDSAEPAQIDAFVPFAEQLSTQGIELIGLLSKMPEALRKQYGGIENLSAAEIFAPAPEVWYPTLEPVLARLLVQVRWWQLGRDEDTSFVDHSNLYPKLMEVKSRLGRVRPDIELGIGWNWQHELPQDPQAPWQCLSLSAVPPLAADELATYLEHGTTPQRRWVCVSPLPRGEYSLETRATDLVQRMITAKAHRADGIFVPDPFNSTSGLMSDDGTPGELLIPWRTVALQLGGAEHLGSTTLPGGSHNQIFARGAEAVMALWSDQPARETLYLGEQVSQIDLWGKSVPLARDESGAQTFESGPMPTLLTGLSAAVMRWRLSFAFGRQQLPPVFDKPHPNSWKVKNPFAQGLSGEIKLVLPEGWTADVPRQRFNLAAGEELEQPFELHVPLTATAGTHAVRVDFEINVDRPYRFSIYRTIEIGSTDIRIELTTQLNSAGDLVIQQRLINETPQPISFRCELFAPARRRLRTQIYDLGTGEDRKVYRLPRGNEIVGQTLWLRAEEIGGPRILNYRVLVDP
ncbi:MAG: hypothetical protein HY000_01120 [Planctomycetes bacterium]|nr:hypothetical protein [Planctomycetota bacterium]